MSRRGLLSVALVVAACSSEVGVRNLDEPISPGAEVNGIPFRVRERMLVDVYQKTDTGYKKIHSETINLPDPDRLYLLELESQALANADTKFVLREDGTLQSVSVTSESQADEALAEMAGGLQSVQQQITAIRTERSAAETTRQAAEVNYVAAYTAAVQAEAQLAELAGAEPESVRKAKQGEVLRLKLLANQAAAAIDLPRPFPEISVSTIGF